MKEYKEFREVVKGRALDDYCQWRAKKKIEIQSKESYALKNMQKYYEYQEMSIENGTIFDLFETNYFSVIGMILTLITSVMITFCSNILNGFLGINTNIDDIEQIKKLVELFQEKSMDIMSIILNGILVMAIMLFLVLLIIL